MEDEIKGLQARLDWYWQAYDAAEPLIEAARRLNADNDCAGWVSPNACMKLATELEKYDTAMKRIQAKVPES